MKMRENDADDFDMIGNIDNKDFEARDLLR